MAYVPTVWIDDDGSNQVGTEFTAARMNKIEQGIANAGTGGGGGGAGVAPVYAQCGGGPYAPVAPLAWTLIPIPAPPTLVISKANGLADDFTRNADGSLTINIAGNYSFDLSLVASAALPDNTNINARLTKKAGALPAVGDGLTGFNVTTGTHANNYATATLSRTALCAAGDRIAIYLYTSGNLQWAVQDFSVALEGGLKGDKGDTGGNATVPIDPWHVVGTAGEPALTGTWTNVGSSDRLKFRKDPLGRVWVQGNITGGANASTAFTLPAGYRPPDARIFDNLQAGGAAGSYVTVSIGGAVGVTVAPGPTVWLDFSFDTELVSAMPTGPKGDKGDTGGNATVPMDPWHQVGTAGEPAFTNGWVATDSNVYYRKDPLGRVYLRGSVNGGANATGAFTLPLGYRPVLTGQNRVRTISIGAQGVAGQWEGQVNIGPDGIVYVYFTGATGAQALSLDQVEFDSGTVTQMPTGPQGAKGDKGDPGNMATVPIEGWITVGQAGGPAYAAGWGVGNQVIRFRKDPLGRVQLNGAPTGGAVGTPIFTLPVGYRPANSGYYDCLLGGGGAGYINIDANSGVVSSGNIGPSGGWFNSIAWDTGLVTAMPTGPQGPKGEPGTGFFKTLDWNTALAPGFYYGGSFNLDGNTLHSPGDPLNIEDQAGVVTINGNMVVQRVWTITTQRAWTRYRLSDGVTWTAWAVDLAKLPVYTDTSVGGITPQDGDERYFQNATMKFYGVMWKFRYDKTPPAGKPPWVFVGGQGVYDVHDGDNFATPVNVWVDAGPAGPGFTVPLQGDYTVEFGGLIYSNVPGVYGQIGVNVAGVMDPRPITHGNFGGGYTDYEDQSRTNRIENIAAGALVKLSYYSNPAGGGFQKRWIRITPIRVYM